MQNLLPDIVQTSRQLAARLPSNLNGAELAAILEASVILEAYIKAAREEADRRIKAGLPVDGWEIVPTSGRRAIPDTVAAWNRMQPLMEFNDFLMCCTVKVGDLTEAIRTIEDVSEKEAKDLLAEYLKGNLIKGPGGEKLQQAPKVIELHPNARKALAEYAAEKYPQKEEALT